jgi:hypothetical protein
MIIMLVTLSSIHVAVHGRFNRPFGATLSDPEGFGSHPEGAGASTTILASGAQFDGRNLVSSVLGSKLCLAAKIMSIYSNLVDKSSVLRRSNEEIHKL